MNFAPTWTLRGAQVLLTRPTPALMGVPLSVGAADRTAGEAARGVALRTFSAPLGGK
jgi:hypothetical protein